ncbi:zinc ribbon domain-containing protein [bacterium]|nr:zinc ribbon domain-containing protein [bacterium]
MKRVTCPKCGAENYETDKQCLDCGEKLAAATATAPATTSAAPSELTAIAAPRRGGRGAVSPKQAAADVKYVAQVQKGLRALYMALCVVIFVGAVAVPIIITGDRVPAGYRFVLYFVLPACIYGFIRGWRSPESIPGLVFRDAAEARTMVKATAFVGVLVVVAAIVGVVSLATHQ